MPIERWTDEQLDGLATSVADLRIAAVSLLETATIHQQGLEVSQRNFQTIISRIDQMHSEVVTMQSEVVIIQSEIRGLQTENRRILDILSGQQGNDNP